MKNKNFKRCRSPEDVKKINDSRVFTIIFALLAAALVYYFYRSMFVSSVVYVAANILSFVYFYLRRGLMESARIRNMESVFPDFLQLMASNLRAGMTVDRAMLLSSRPEFAPLDSEILTAGKDITTGKIIENALLDMSERIKSDKIHKTILLIISGMRAGGDIAVLLEETAANMRERDFVEKRAGSNVTMYSIFIFLAVSIGAPVLFGLSTVLVGILTTLLSGLPEIETPNVPFTLSSISILTTFINYFSIVFIVMLDVFACLVLGLVSKGEEKEGSRYLIPLLLMSLGIFFLVRFFLAGFLAGLF